MSNDHKEALEKVLGDESASISPDSEVVETGDATASPEKEIEVGEVDVEDRDALAKMLGLEPGDYKDLSVPPEQEDEETSDDDAQLSDETPQESTESDEKQQGDTDTTEDADEAFLSQFEDAEGQTGEDPFVKARQTLDQQKAILFQEAQLFQQQDPFEDLPDMRDESGKSIYEMTRSEFNGFLRALRDDERDGEYSEASSAYEQALRVGKERAKQMKLIQQKAHELDSQYDVLNHSEEWDKAQQEWQKKVPMLRDEGNVNKIREWLQHKLTHTLDNGLLNYQYDPGLVESVKTIEGKHKAIYSAYKALGFTKSTKPDGKESAQKSASATPDAKANSKKVITKTKGDKSYLSNQKWTKKQMEQMSEEDALELLASSIGM